MDRKEQDKREKPPEQQPTGNYTNGHPGVPPKNYKQPREKR